MTVWTIRLEQISTGIQSDSMIVRRDTEAAAREYAEDAIKGHADLCVVSIIGR